MLDNLKPEDEPLGWQYNRRFGHPVPMASLQSVRPEEIDRLIKAALESGEPVPGWADLPWASTEPKGSPSKSPERAPFRKYEQIENVGDQKR